VGESFPHSELRVISANDTVMPGTLPAMGRFFFVGCGPRDSGLRKLRMGLYAWREALFHRPDELLCGHINFAPLAWALKCVAAPHVSLIAHGVEAWSPPSDLRWAARRSDQVLAVSRYTADRMADWGVSRERLRIIPDTVDGEVFRPIRRRGDGGGPVLLTVARLDAAERSKGLDQVIGQLPALRRRFPGIRYVVGGTGSDVPRLRQLAADLGVAEAVEFLGYVPDEMLPVHLSGADAFVMPSRKEGFGIVFIEAMACGVPVIACGLEGSRDALLDGRVGVLVDPERSGELETAIANTLMRREPSLVDGRRLRSEVLRAFGTERFRGLIKEGLLIGGAPR
jgi:glycosyltransferase involved in cell wall biosynthesis